MQIIALFRQIRSKALFRNDVLFTYLLVSSVAHVIVTENSRKSYWIIRQLPAAFGGCVYAEPSSDLRRISFVDIIIKLFLEACGSTFTCVRV